MSRPIWIQYFFPLCYKVWNWVSFPNYFWLKTDVDLMWNWLWWSRKPSKRINWTCWASTDNQPIDSMLRSDDLSDCSTNNVNMYHKLCSLFYKYLLNLRKKRIHSQRIQMQIMYLQRFLNVVSFNWLFLLKAYTFFNLLDLPKFYAFFSMLLIASSLTVSISLFPSGSSPSGSAPCEIQKKKWVANVEQLPDLRDPLDDTENLEVSGDNMFVL